MSPEYLPGLREPGDDVEVFDFTPKTTHRVLRPKPGLGWAIVRLFTTRRWEWRRP